MAPPEEKEEPAMHDRVPVSVGAEVETLLPFERIKRQILIKKGADTAPKYGVAPDRRTIPQLLEYGIVNIDKPEGPSSHQVSAYVKGVVGLDKAGHSGTLDPGVTGCLPVALGHATRVVQSLLTAGKEYVCVMHLHEEVPEEKVRAVLGKFVGKIRQLPPVKSAVKRQWRFRRVYYIKLLEIQGKNVCFLVGSQAGTYIRKLVHDIGQEIGCGAHMLQLRRTKAGPFTEESLVTLQDLADAMHYYREKGDDTALRKAVLPFEVGIGHLPKLWVFDTTVDSVCHGASLKVPGISRVESDIQVGEPVAILTLKGELVAVGVARMISQDIIKQERGIAAILTQVFMNPGTYPRMDNKAPEEQGAKAHG